MLGGGGADPRSSARSGGRCICSTTNLVLLDLNTHLLGGIAGGCRQLNPEYLSKLRKPWWCLNRPPDLRFEVYPYMSNSMLCMMI